MKARKRDNLRRRHRRVRVKIRGTEARPRLSVFVSNKQFYSQLIDDVDGKTLASASTLEKDSSCGTSCTIDSAEKLGGILAARAVAKGIEAVVFDRGGFRYHGKVKAFADSARKAGLLF